MTQRNWKCARCHMVIGYEAGRGRPDQKFGGLCTRDSQGNHLWLEQAR